MGRRLVENVIVADESGGAFLCSAGLVEADLPGWAVEQIQNPNVWVEDAAPAAAPVDPAAAVVDEGDAPPPKSGPGSAKAAWVAYAQSHGVEVEDDATRDDIVAAVAAAGVAVE